MILRTHKSRAQNDNEALIPATARHGRAGSLQSGRAGRFLRQGKLKTRRYVGRDVGGCIGRGGGGEEEADAAAPEGEEEDADEDEGEAEADPEAESSPMAVEAEPSTEGKTNQPVRREVAEHGRARVAGAAERAGGDGLDAVEELEGGAGSEKGDGGADDGFVSGVDAGDVARENEEDDAHEGHEGGTEEDGGVTGVAGGERFAAADGLADANGSGGREAERNHVGEGDGVERDLMTGLGNGAETGDERSDQSEDADFGGKLNRGGKTESDELADAVEVGVHGSFEEFGFVAGVVPEEIEDEDQREIGARDAGGDAGTGDAEGRASELAVDEDVVANEVDKIGGDESEGDGANHVHTLESATNSEVEEERDETGGKRTHVGSGEDGDGMGDAEAFEVKRNDPNGDGEEGSDGKAEIEAVDERAVAVFALASTEGLGHEGIEADEEAFAEEGEDDEEAGADADGADGFGAVGEAADHHGVHDDHAHPADFGEDERKGEAERGTEFVAEDGEEGHGGSKKISENSKQKSVIRNQEKLTVDS